MMELLVKAWAGWTDYITQGKLMALFAGVLLFLWFGKKVGEKKAFVLYATVAGACCVVPVTATVLMAYQTKFYDYEWIWSAVPVTAVVAYGLTIFLTEGVREGKFGKKTTALCVVALCMVAIVLCGNLGEKKADSYSAYMKVLYPYNDGGREEVYRQQAYRAVEELRQVTGEGDVVLWAPIEVMEYAREADGGLRLLYGRNMWDESLNGYTYDVYEDALYELYLWIETVDGSMDLWSEELREDAAALPEDAACVKKARESGVNCVLLSGETPEEKVQLVAEIFGTKAQRIEEYWVIYE